MDDLTITLRIPAEQLKSIFAALIEEAQRPPVVVTGRLDLGYINRSEMASLCGVSHNTLLHRIEAGIVPAPTHPYKQRNYYTADDTPKVREALAKHEQRKGNMWDDLAAQGLYSCEQAAGMLNIPKATFTVWLREGLLPKPTRPTRYSYKTYSTEDVEAMRNIIAERGYERREFIPRKPVPKHLAED